MSKEGAPALDVPQLAGKMVPVIASAWHEKIMAGLIDGSKRAITEAGGVAEIITVPGSFELPVVAKHQAQQHGLAVALGVVIRGGTPHFDYVCAGVTQGLMSASLELSAPIGFGVLTCDDEAQALDRAGLPGSAEDKGHEAATAALITYQVLHSGH